jgi:hypothetical protein
MGICGIIIQFGPTLQKTNDWLTCQADRACPVTINFIYADEQRPYFTG